MRTALTARHRRLIEANLDLADRVARTFRGRTLSFEERIASARYGLVLAALAWRGRGDFRGYAFVRARGQVLNDIRERLDWTGRRRGLPDTFCWPARDDLGTDAAMALLGQLPEIEAVSLWLGADGWSIRRIAPAVGRTPEAVRKAQRRAIARLRRDADPQ